MKKEAIKKINQIVTWGGALYSTIITTRLTKHEKVLDNPSI